MAFRLWLGVGLWASIVSSRRRDTRPCWNAIPSRVVASGKLETVWRNLADIVVGRCRLDCSREVWRISPYNRLGTAECPGGSMKYLRQIILMGMTLCVVASALPALVSVTLNTKRRWPHRRPCIRCRLTIWFEGKKRGSMTWVPRLQMPRVVLPRLKMLTFDWRRRGILREQRLRCLMQQRQGFGTMLRMPVGKLDGFRMMRRVMTVHLIVWLPAGTLTYRVVTCR